MAGITGIGSGIDIDSIVTALVNAERAPKQGQLDRLEKTTTERISAVGTLRSAVSELNSTLEGLNTLSAFQKQTVFSTNSSILTATASGTLPVARFNLQVQQLASSSKVALQSVAGGTSSTFNSGTLTISAGSSTLDVDVTAGKNKLTDIRDAINTAGVSKGISASIVSDASGSRLVLSSTKTGEGNDIQVVASEDGVTTGTNSLTTQAFKPTASLPLPVIAGGPTSTFKSGTLDIVAGSVSLNLNIADGDDLTSIRDAVNAAGTGQGVSASIETDSAGSRLVINSTNGATVGVTATSAGVGTDVGANALTALNPASGSVAKYSAPSAVSGAAGVINTAQSAKFSVDGLQVTKLTNTVDDVISGLTINLLSAQSADDIAAGKTVDVNISQDKGTVSTNLKKFVDAYNKLVSTTSQLTAVVQVGEGKAPVVGPMLGDSSIRNLLTGMRKELSTLADAAGVRSLADLGITTKKDGTLSLDSAKLDTALASNYDKVATYLTGTDGLMARLSAVVKPYSTADGVLDQRQKGLQSTLTSVDKQQAALDLRIEKVQERLLSQYNAMDSLVAQLKKTSESLTGMLANLPGFVQKK